MKCLSSCNRQENSVEISYYKFPNRMFLRSEDVINLVKSLVLCAIQANQEDPFWTRGIQNCPFFDGITKEGLAAEVNESFTVHQFFAGLNLNSADLKDQLMLYASDNLVRINAFLDSPYLSKFQIDEVVIFRVTQYLCLS